MAESYSIEIALAYMRDSVGFTCTEMANVTHNISAKDFMGKVLHRFDKAIHGSKY